MNLKLYNCSDDPRTANKTKTAEFSTDCEIWGDCDIVNPVLILEYSAEALQRNYAYISTFSRYYFVDGRTIQHGDHIILRLRCDVLGTLYPRIPDNTMLFVERSSGTIRPYMPDTGARIEAGITETITDFGSYFYDTNLADVPNTIITCVKSAGNTPAVNSGKYAGMGNASIGFSYVRYIVPLTYATTVIHLIQESSYETARSALVAINLFPCNLQQIATHVTSANLIIADKDFELPPVDMIDGGSSTVPIVTNEITIARGTNWRDFYPYRELYLDVPVIGRIPLDTNMIASYGGKIRVKYTPDFVNCQVCAEIQYNKGEGYITINSCVSPFGMALPITSSNAEAVNTNNAIKAVASVAGAVGGIASAVATGGATAPLAISSAIGLASTTASIIYNNPQVTSTASTGATTWREENGKFRLIERRKKIDTTPGMYNGFPLLQEMEKESIYGYNVLGNNNITVSGATLPELTEFRSILTSGFYVKEA